jgi:outer membrane protein assembly factor BamB
MRHRVDFDSSIQVVLDEQRAYFGSTVDHRVYCVDSQTGRTLWSFYTDGPIRLAPTLAHENVYFGSDDGQVYCLRAADGQVVWQMRVAAKDDRLLSRGEMISRWPVRTGVLIDGDIAYFGAGIFPHETVYLCAVHAKTGEVIWRNDRISQEDAGRNDLSPQGYLLSNQDYLYVPSGRSLPVAVDKATGEIVFQRKYSWRTDAGGVVGGTKALLGDGQVYAGGPHHFLAMEQRTGEAGASYIAGRQMVLADEFAYLLDGSKIFCVDRAEHARASQEKQQWFLRAREVRDEPAKVKESLAKMQEYSGVGILWEFPSTFDGTMIATQNLVIAGGMNGVVALDRQSGKRVWESAVDGNVTGLSATEQLLIASTDQGHIYGFSPTAGKSIRQWPEPYTEAFPQDERTDFYHQAALEILERSGQKNGYCLVVGNEEGRLAYELAKLSALNVIAVEPDGQKAQRARKAFEQAGIHATRITVVNAPLDQIPFSNYFANLIVSDTSLQTGSMPCKAEDVARFLKPCGGVAMLGYPDKLTRPATWDNRESEQWLTSLYHQDEGELVLNQAWSMLRRDKLPGAGEWTHQYGNPANTSFTNDQRVRDGLGVLWYGDPGPSSIINRHEAAGAPLSTNGRMFIQGTDSVMAYDAYNGTFLWEYKNPGAIRTGVFNNRETHNLAASDDHLFVAVADTCVALDAASGQVVAEYKTPASSDGLQRAWAYVSYDNGQLFGTSTLREELEEKLRRRGLTVKSQTDAVFAVDTRTGETLWTYRGDNILHTTIALDDESIYFIDSSLTPAERQELYRRDKGALKNLTGEAALKAEAEYKDLDVRLAVALDRSSGDVQWQRPVNVTDTTDVSSGGGSLTIMAAEDCLVLCGANANGHYWKQFLSGEFAQRKLVVLDSKTGDELWSKNANYMNRPAVIQGHIYAEPWAFNLRSGEPKTRSHPLTGEESPWQFSRPGHHCGIITATPNMMFFRSGFIGYYDLYHGSGTRHFAGQRMGCWINAIPGNGLVMIPEASAGCVCQFSIESTVVMEPKSEEKSWGIFSAVGKMTPVQRIGINFGAPGDRKDVSGREWLGFPRPLTVNRLEFDFDIQSQLAERGSWYSRNPDSLAGVDGDLAWLVASGARGLQSCEIPLLGPEDKPATYQVTLYFAGMSRADVEATEVQLQGSPVQGVVQLASEDIAAIQPVIVVEYDPVAVKDNLVLKIGSRSESKPGNPALANPVLSNLSAIEVVRID